MIRFSFHSREQPERAGELLAGSASGAAVLGSSRFFGVWEVGFFISRPEQGFTLGWLHRFFCFGYRLRWQGNIIGYWERLNNGHPQPKVPSGGI
jgi:hypothetical protein